MADEKYASNMTTYLEQSRRYAGYFSGGKIIISEREFAGWLGDKDKISL